MASVDSAVVAQVPEPNQYWEYINSKDRAYFIGRDPDGRMVWQCEGDCIEVGNLDWSGWRHIPGCTGWDWEPEEFPQYYVGTGWLDGTAYVLRSSPKESHAVDKWGTEFGYSWDDIAKRFVERGTLVRVTAAEAMARLDKPAAEETYPQYWTTRNSFSYLYVVVESPTVWKAVTTAGAIEDWTHRVFDSTNRTRLTEQEALALLDKPADRWPKYYVNRDPGLKWYVRAENHRDLPNVYLPDGSACTSQANWDDIDDSLSRGVWVEVTEAEARARIAVAAEPRIEVEFLPVAPEMDWVVQDRVPARNNVDEWAWCKCGSSPGYFYSGFGGWSSTIMHGHVDGDEVLHLRCKRKDLPPVPAPIEETFPQWYILKDDEKRSWVPDWTVKRTGEDTAIRYARDEAGQLYATDEPWTGAPDCWERCSDAEAIVRMGTLMFPRVPSEHRRVPVKLWVTYRLNDEGGDWPVRATQADQTCQNWKEIKFDGNGAFIEVDQ